MYWICLSVFPQFLQTQGEKILADLLLNIFQDDYLEHYLLDYDKLDKNCELDRYVFVHCLEYEKYIEDLKRNKYIKNILNSFHDVVTIPEEEILETKSSVKTIVHDEEYCVNRTGFFMFGDIVKVLSGSVSSMNGIVIKRSKKNPDFYLVYFRLFVHRFYREIHVSNMEFHSSIFKYVKIPIRKGQIMEATKRIKNMIKLYESLLKENQQKRLVNEPILNKEEIDITDLVLSSSKK